jgi:intracellular septation protein
MKVLFDFLPLLLFFVALKRFDIFVATAVAIAASVAQIVWRVVRRQKVETVAWVSLVIIVVFGGATIALRDETFIKWKPTVLYWIGALVIGGGELLGRSALRGLLGTQLTLPGPVWRRLAWAWTAFFAALGALNLFVAFSYSTETWATFKVFGATALLLVFVIAQSFFLSKYLEEPSEPTDGA